LLAAAENVTDCGERSRADRPIHCNSVSRPTNRHCLNSGRGRPPLSRSMALTMPYGDGKAESVFAHSLVLSLLRDDGKTGGHAAHHASEQVEQANAC